MSSLRTRLFATGALLAACSAMPTYANILAIDIDDVATSNTEPGFDALTLDTGGAGQMIGTFDGITIDVDSVGSAFGSNDRKRNTPVNGGDVTEALIMQDFVFNFGNAAPGTKGIDATVSGLSANTWYRTEVWSFDTASTGARVSDWSTTGGNGTVIVADDYTFDGAVLPTVNDDAKFSFWVQTDNSGAFTLSGRNATTTAANAGAVFFNGLAITHRAHSSNQVYRIDLNSGDPGGQALVNTPGWTSLDTTGAANSAVVTIDGIDFQPFSADGSRNRAAGTNSLTSDFIFDDGSNNSDHGEAVGLLFGDAGDLQAGTWLVEMYIWDDDDPGMDNVIVGLRRNNAETIIDTDVSPREDDPAIVFTFESDGIGRYDVFVRDAPDGDIKARLNAVTLTYIPEPTSLALLGLGGLLTLRRRRG